MKLTLSDKIKFSIAAIKKHGFLLGMGLTFLIIGCFLIYLSISYDNNIPLLVVGGFVTLFMGFFLGYTMPSSLLYYYEKEVIKKYGSYSTAIVINKQIENLSYIEKTDSKAETIEEFNYLIDYKYTYQKEYTNSFFVRSKTCYDKLEVGAEIPIKFLRIKPQKSEPQRRKLCKDLGLEYSECN